MSEKNTKKQVISVLGPTASGKTSVAIKIAKEYNGIIVNCDSRQIYEEMLIGTASPTDEEKNIVEHRLFNFLSPKLQFNASDYANLAAEEIKKICQENKLPVLVGGTGFYYSAISEGLGEAGSDSELSNNLLKELEENGLPYMVEKLKSLDSEAYNNVDINNSRRVLRAIEVVITTGRPFSQNKPKSLLPEAEFIPIVVSRPRDILHKRIELRVEQMFEEGLENEVRQCVEKYGKDAAALSSIGYREWLDYFDRKISYEQVKEQIMVHTRQYAKRQETWFRKKPGVPFINLEAPEALSNILSSLKSFI
jgi:tRNA dimethylallyltransferase